MNLGTYKHKLLKLQNSMNNVFQIHDTQIEVIEIIFYNTGHAASCPQHMHTWYEFNYVTSGRVQTALIDKTFETGSGEFFLVSPGVEHSHKYDNKAPHEGICMRWQMKRDENCNFITGEGLYDFLDSLSSCDLGSVRDSFSLLNLFIRLFDEADNNFSQLNLQLSIAKILSVLAEICRPCKKIHPDNSKISGSNSAKDNIERKVEVLLNDCIFRKINVRSLAASLHISYGYMARIYKKATGRTILDRLGEIRLEKSLKLLENPEYSIKQISEKAGFSNQYYYSGVFKERFGKSPAKYRKTL